MAVAGTGVSVGRVALVGDAATAAGAETGVLVDTTAVNVAVGSPAGTVGSGVAVGTAVLVAVAGRGVTVAVAGDPQICSKLAFGGLTLPGQAHPSTVPGRTWYDAPPTVE